MFVLLVFVRIFAIAADIICRYQVLFSKVMSDLGGFSFRMGQNAIATVGGDRFVGEVKSDPRYPATDSAHWLGIWGWIGPLFTSPSPNPRINTKMDF